MLILQICIYYQIVSFYFTFISSLYKRAKIRRVSFNKKMVPQIPCLVYSIILPIKPVPSR